MPVLFSCPICTLNYREQSWAKKCEDWCSTHPSCSLEIIRHAVRG